MCFYHILHKNSIGHLLRASRDYFCHPPPPKSLNVCRTLTKIWPKNIDFHRYSYNVRERAVQKAVVAPTPLSHQKVIDLFFFRTTYINNVQ